MPYDVPNLRQPAPSIFTGGRPSEQQLREAKEAKGIHSLVDLCPKDEHSWYGAEDLAKKVGLNFFNIPIRGAADLTRENALRLHGIISDPANQVVLLQCITGNRAGALFGALAFYAEQHSIEEAIAIGKAAGMRWLEPGLRKQLAGLPNPDGALGAAQRG